MCFFSDDAIEHKFIQSYMRTKKEVNNTALSAAILFRDKHIHKQRTDEINIATVMRFCGL